jgi:hypothetical protein
MVNPPAAAEPTAEAVCAGEVVRKIAVTPWLPRDEMAPERSWSSI